MVQQLANGLIKILNKAGEAVGTGFLIAENLAVTCAHVIEEVGEVTGGSLRIQFYQANSSNTYFGTILAVGQSSNEADDVAILMLDNIPEGVRPLKLGEAAQSEGHTFASLAYTSTSTVVTQRVTGSIQGLVKKRNGQGELLQITGDLFDVGSSGAPILDTTLDLVVGMACFRETTQHTRIAFAIPVETLFKYVSVLSFSNSSENFSHSLSSSSDTLTILHLTDLKFGEITNASNSIKESFLRDLKNISTKGDLAPNLVLVTGDIAYSGKQDEYKQAIYFFKRLLAITNLPPHCLLLIPGNHDEDRSATLLQGTLKEPDNHSLGDLDNLTLYENQSLRNYFDFTNQLFGTPQTFDYGGILSFRRFNLRSNRISFLSINTVELKNQYSEDVSEFYQRWTGNHLMIDFDIHHHAELRVALLHHPSWGGSNTSDIWGSLLPTDCNFVFFGHNHTEDLGISINAISPGDHNATIFISNSMSSIRSIDKSTYGLLKIDLSSRNAQYYSRCFDPARSEWIADGQAINLSLPKSFPESISTANLNSVILPGYNCDDVTGQDHLSITKEVNAFATVFSAKQMIPPLCVGIFGDWGSGKTFFMRKLQQRIDLIANIAKKAEEQKEQTDFCGHVVQIEFNAWHYSDTNLWASLIGHIFERLDTYLDELNLEEKRQELFRELAQARDQVQEAQKRCSTAEDQLDLAEQEVRKRSMNLNLALDRFISALKDNPDYKDQIENLEQSAKAVGFVDAAQAIDQGWLAFQNTSKAGVKLASRSRLLINALFNTPTTGLLILLFISLLLLPLLVGYLLSLLHYFQINVDWINAVVVQIVSFLTGIVTWAGIFIKKASSAVNSFEQGLQSIETFLQKARDQDPDVLKKERELLNARQEEQAALQALEQIKKQLEDAEITRKKTEQIVSGRALAEFIHDQASKSGYTTNLGIISMIRQDLEKLDHMMDPGKRSQIDDDKDLPFIDRVILYIDDLDRCSEQQVVDVLQAIHLLLAFRLFVVVVCVDPRWLLHALECAYPTLKGGTSPSRSEQWADEELRAWEATPQNYLEKIFQIPFHLRTMQAQGFKDLMDSLMTTGAKQENYEPIASSNPTMEIDEQLETVDRKGENYIVQEPEVNIEFHISSSSTNGSQQEITLTSASLSFEPTEREMVHLLADLIPTPRAAKRFLNIYRLIKATLTERELPAFLGKLEETDNAGYQSVMILLAILTGFPRLTPALFRKWLSLDNSYSFRNAVNLIQTYPTDGGFTNGILSTMSSSEVEEWNTLYHILSILVNKHSMPATIKGFNQWIPVVARYSFRSGKVIAQRTISNVHIKSFGLDPVGPVPQGEFVKVNNSSDKPQVMTGWTIRDSKDHTYVFPTFILPAHGEVRVWTGVGMDSTSDLYWGRKSPVWNQQGNQAMLSDAFGHLVHVHSS